MDAVRGCWGLTRSARVYFVDVFKKGAAVDNMNYFGVIKRSVKSTKYKRRDPRVEHAGGRPGGASRENTEGGNVGAGAGSGGL